GPLLGRQRNGGGAEQRLCVSQDDLVEDVVKLQRDLDLPNWARAVVEHGTEDEGHFLIEEVCRARHFRLEKLDLWHIGLLRWAHGQRLFDCFFWRRCQAPHQIKDTDQQQRCHRTYQQNNWRPAFFVVHEVLSHVLSFGGGFIVQRRAAKPGLQGPRLAPSDLAPRKYRTVCARIPPSVFRDRQSRTPLA